MEFQNCESRVLWELDRAENALEAEKDKNKELEGQLAYARGIIGICGQLLELKTDGTGLWWIESALGRHCELREGNDNDKQIIEMMKGLFYKEQDNSTPAGVDGTGTGDNVFTNAIDPVSTTDGVGSPDSCTVLDSIADSIVTPGTYTEASGADSTTGVADAIDISDIAGVTEAETIGVADADTVVDADHQDLE